MRIMGRKEWIVTLLVLSMPASLILTTAALECDEFKCADGLKCTQWHYRCDGEVDCFDASDEDVAMCQTVPCSELEIDCPEARRRGEFPACRLVFYKCDGAPDCPHAGEDELNCECDSSQFKCNDNSCIPTASKCDDKDDCPDGEDEDGCPTCDVSSQFKCNDNSCIPIGSKCDETDDCPNGEDENGCPTCDVSSQFKCNDNTCIPTASKCDDKDDCPDGEDEDGCPTCDANSQFKCNDNTCIPTASKCDDKDDCPNGEDEDGCPTCDVSSPFKCNDNTCIPIGSKCDGKDDCPDGEDEDGCPTCDVSSQFKCNDNTCIPTASKCDDKDDCSDGEDEDGCPTCDATSQFKCNDNTCIPIGSKCDRNEDCPTGEDETDCTLQVNVIGVSSDHVEAGSDFSIFCVTTKTTEELIFNWLFRQESSQTWPLVGQTHTLSITNASEADSGWYKCSVTALASNHKGEASQQITVLPTVRPNQEKPGIEKPTSSQSSSLNIMYIVLAVGIPVVAIVVILSLVGYTIIRKRKRMAGNRSRHEKPYEMPLQRHLQPAAPVYTTITVAGATPDLVKTVNSNAYEYTSVDDFGKLQPLDLAYQHLDRRTGYDGMEVMDGEEARGPNQNPGVCNKGCNDPNVYDEIPEAMNDHNPKAINDHNPKAIDEHEKETLENITNLRKLEAGQSTRENLYVVK